MYRWSRVTLLFLRYLEKELRRIHLFIRSLTSGLQVEGEDLMVIQTRSFYKTKYVWNINLVLKQKLQSIFGENPASTICVRCNTFLSSLAKILSRQIQYKSGKQKIKTNYQLIMNAMCITCYWYEMYSTAVKRVRMGQDHNWGDITNANMNDRK